MADNKTKLAALWRETDKNGGTYLTGPINATSRILIFPTTAESKAKNPKAPDFNAYIVPVAPAQDKGAPKPNDI
jgi:hypothetical protein